jgi:2-oxoglutarate ferredoxin oxidoreductase subunit alpha
MRFEFEAARIGKLRSVLHFNGLPIDARSITDEILAQEGLKDLESSNRTLVSAGE